MNSRGLNRSRRITLIAAVILAALFVSLVFVTLSSRPKPWLPEAHLSTVLNALWPDLTQWRSSSWAEMPHLLL